MSKKMIYDVPFRLFHWLLAGGFIVALAIAKTVDDESPLFRYHMIIGILLSVVVILRVIWGLVGSHYARFSHLPLAPNQLLTYFKQLALPVDKSQRYIGHNPASAYAALIMFLCTVGLAFSGIMMGQKRGGEFFEEIHEFFAYTFLITAVAHILGVIFHSIKHKDLIGLSMMTGEKKGLESEVEGRPHVGAAIVFLLLILFSSAVLLKQLDAQSGQLKILGMSLQLGEQEDETKEKVNTQGQLNNDDDEDEENEYE